MGGHEGNTNSTIKRCFFFVTFVTTVYGVMLISENWPNAHVDHPNSSLKEAKEKPNPLTSFLQELDQWYENEIDVHHEEDSHDETEGHGDDDHDEHDEDLHVSAKEQASLLPPLPVMSSSRGDMTDDSTEELEDFSSVNRKVVTERHQESNNDTDNRVPEHADDF